MHIYFRTDKILHSIILKNYYAIKNFFYTTNDLFFIDELYLFFRKASIKTRIYNSQSLRERV